MVVKAAVRSGLMVVLALGAVCGYAGIALADVKAGVDAWADGDFAGAVREWQGPADAGDPDAQFNLAQAYKLGRGVPRDPARAEALYARAAAKGHLQASDNYGLLLFQRGERVKALPYVQAAAARGDARAQYIWSLALFNGDGVPKDWVRAYAYATVAQQAGLQQAASALAQMDQHVSMADRQKSVPIATQITADAQATRARQMAAADLGGAESERAVVGDRMPVPAPTSSAPTIATAERAVADAARVAGTASPATAGADYTVAKPRVAAAPARAVGVTRMVNGVPTPCTPENPCIAPPPVPNAPPAARSTVTTRSATSASTVGPWRLQLGAFGVASNADALWLRVKARPELAGHAKVLVPAGRLTKLQAGGFASQAEANAACARLKSGGFTCIATR